jgi:hypothetical protein
MRKFLILASAGLACGLVFGIGSSAIAAPLPGLSSSTATSGLVEPVGWRKRYYRRYGVLPTAPGAPEGDVIVDTDDGAVVVAPLRPLSCGEYHYWNGEACVDARYNDPYLGPK